MIDRHPIGFAGHIPQGDIDPTDRFDKKPARVTAIHHDAVHQLPEHFGFPRIFAAQYRRDLFYNRLQRLGGEPGHALADADQALIGQHLDNGGSIATKDDGCQLIGVGQGNRRADAMLKGYKERYRSDLGDFHRDLQSTGASS